MAKVETKVPLKDYERHKLERGEWIGFYPYGYTTMGQGKRTKYSSAQKVILHPEQSEHIRKIFEWYATGTFSYKSLKKKIKEELSVEFHISSIERILKNKFYMGVMDWKKHIYEHRYPRIVSRELFEKVQTVKNYNNKYRLYAHDHAQEIKTNEAEEKQSNSLVNILTDAHSIAALSKKTGMTIGELMLELFDLELNNEIREESPGIWKKI